MPLKLKSYYGQMTDNFLIYTNAVLLALQGNQKLKELLQNKAPISPLFQK